MKIHDFQPQILRYYSGRHLQTVRDVTLPALEECAKQGYWSPHVSRRVKATLNKTSHKLVANAKDGALACHGDSIAVEYAQFMRAPRMLAEARAKFTGDGPPRAAAAYLDWCSDFAPVAEIITTLDATRPKPVYVFATISPVVFENVGQALGLRFDTVRMPLITWEKIESKDEKGRPVYEWVPKIHWPEGTKHNTSKFSCGSRAGNDQCQACGHAIRNYSNWVPLVLDCAEGPRSLWVGRDCAEHLFGCKVTGQVKFDARIVPA